MATLINSSVVILAQEVNQSIFRPNWLVNQGIILGAEADNENLMYAPGITRIPTAEFEFVVFPDRLQLTVAPSNERGGEAVHRVLGGVVKALPHTPFTAVGLNFSHRLHPAEPSKFFEWNLAKLSCSWARQHVKPGDTRARFGTTFAFDAFGARLRVRVAVTALQGAVTPENVYSKEPLPYVAEVHCNLHRDLPPAGAAQELVRMLSLWTDARHFTNDLVASLLDEKRN